MNIGFIGLGLMGLPMAKNILKAGFPLTVFNRTPSKATELASLGASVAQSPQEVAQRSDVVITMVTAPGDVETVLFGSDGVVKGNHKNLLVMDMSTIGPNAAQLIGRKLESHAIAFIDAPVTGSTPKAISGELTIFVGGTQTDVKKVMPVLQSMGKTITRVGEIGRGQAIKMVNNYLIAATIVVAAEGMKLADTMQLPRSRVVEILGNTPTVSGIMKLKLPNFASDEYPLLFTMKNMLKDLTLAAIEKNQTSQKLPIFEQVAKLYTKAVADGLANDDFSEIIKILP